jgi:acyl-CoA synthetase (AMP-forming)/AMP-acid ligase II
MLTWPAERYPDRIALTFQGQHWTFREVEDANRSPMASWSQLRGDRVAALLYNSPRAAEVRFAPRRRGPHGGSTRQAAAEHALSSTTRQSPLILDGDYLHTWEHIRAHCPDVRQVIVAALEPGAYRSYEALIAASSSVAPEVMVSLDDLERIAYTSGTTGRPKGIMKTIGNDLAQLRNDFLNEDVPTTAADIMLNVAPLTHAARGPLRKHYVKGARNIILRDFDEETVFATIAQERVTRPCSCPPCLSDAHRKLDYDLSSPAHPFGTAPMPEKAGRRPCSVMFGKTTACLRRRSLSCACRHRIWPSRPHQAFAAPGAPRPPGPGWRCVSPTTVAQRSAWCRRQPSGRNRHARLRRDPDATCSARRAGWLHTGIWRRMRRPVYIVGRKKDMIISGGFNIYPREVELVIERHPGVQEVAVIGVPDAIWGEAVKAVVVPRPGATLTVEEIIDLCTQHIASYKKPRSVDIVADFPRNFQGKILKRELRERYWQSLERRV